MSDFGVTIIFQNLTPNSLQKRGVTFFKKQRDTKPTSISAGT